MNYTEGKIEYGVARKSEEPAVLYVPGVIYDDIKDYNLPENTIVKCIEKVTDPEVLQAGIQKLNTEINSLTAQISQLNQIQNISNPLSSMPTSLTIKVGDPLKEGIKDLIVYDNTQNINLLPALYSMQLSSTPSRFNDQVLPNFSTLPPFPDSEQMHELRKKDLDPDEKDIPSWQMSRKESERVLEEQKKKITLKVNGKDMEEYNENQQSILNLLGVLKP